jgi:23S rRNA (uridine2552-2'-O)-methyltransferase
MGTGFDDYLRQLRARFGRVVIRKPEASRKRSAEVYALATARREGPVK